jgi:hypothetical protein
MVQSQPREIVCEKKERTGRVTEVVEHLPNKHEALSSNSSAKIKKKKKVITVI